MGKLISLTREECYRSIPSFYRLIASKLGVDDDEVSSYNPCLICSSEGVFNVIGEYYKNEENLDSVNFGMIWLCHGCKANLESDCLIVSVEEGFMELKESNLVS